ncbi:nucleotidyltransferase domain-containing protein [Roseibium salinum]|nr:nucleotidyltransferase domain-containing protein [Roseibium salinum]
MQDLLNQLVEEYVQREDRQAPVATEVLRRLRHRRDALSDRGVRHLYLFGSVARGDARPDSDIDLAYELHPNVKLSLFDLGKIEDLIRTALAIPNEIDLVPRSKMFSHVQDTASDDEILVF